MLRKKAIPGKKESIDHIRWRGHEITRIEAFSDAVFAFAVTLLIMSLEVPKNFDELMHALHFILPFGICFAMTIIIWYQQNIFFRRYGLHDLATITLNGILMFAVLIYMFPLKFLIGSALTPDFHFNDPEQQVPKLYCLYSGGFGFFYLLFALMYLNAYFKRSRLDLGDNEAFTTLSHVYSYLIISIVSVISVTIALLGIKYLGYAGVVYSVLGPAMFIFHKKRNKIYLSRFAIPTEDPAENNIIEELEPIPDDRVN